MTLRGRGAGLNPSGRFEPQAREALDDGWQTLETLEPFRTEVQVEKHDGRRVVTPKRGTDRDLPADLVLLAIGFWLIRSRRIEAHRRVMTAAFATSS